MNAAFSIWKKRIAPVFDVASRAIIVSKESGPDRPQRAVSVPTGTPADTVAALLGWRVGTLVCGAISRQLYNAIAAQRITIHSFLTGESKEVIQAWRADTLASPHFIMPGCSGRSAISHGREVLGEGALPRGKNWGRGHSGAKGRWAKRHGHDARPGKDVRCQQHAVMTDASSQSWQLALCLCPHCGCRIVPVPGIPCAEQTCPNCHALLVRT